MRFRLPNVDRVGLVMDISRILAERHINILSMEVDLRVIFLEVQPLSHHAARELAECLLTVPGILDVEMIDLMPHQERSQQIQAMLTSVQDGIIAIDRHGRIIQCNPAAEKLLHCPVEEILGKWLEDIFPPASPLRRTLESGKSYHNEELFFEKVAGHCLATSTPLLDATGFVSGAMVVLRDIRDVQELVHRLTGSSPFTFAEIIFTSAAMQEVVSQAQTYARSDSTVLIRGETGTGKELIARALHAASPRNAKAFLPVNCAAIPDALLESELFGYEEGSFTGAVKGGKAGLFELANGGTLFLDEIGEVSSHLQAKLLRVLQERKVRRLGSTREQPINVRILAATNRPLETLMAQGTFREDLYYRLNVIPLFLPPLRERLEDIAPLSHFFLHRFATKLQKNVQDISGTALEKLKHYHWPGNIRELENIIERACNIVSGPILLSEHIFLPSAAIPSNVPEIPAKKAQSLAASMQAVEKQLLTEAMGEYRSARQLGLALGLSHTAILKKLRKYGLSAPGSSH